MICMAKSSAAEFKEIVISAHRVLIEHVGPNCDEYLFHGRLWRNMIVCHRRPSFRERAAPCDRSFRSPSAVSASSITKADGTM
jgi:hypothetical protein